MTGWLWLISSTEKLRPATIGIPNVSKYDGELMPRISAVGSLPRAGMGWPSTVNFIMRMRVMGSPSEKLADFTPGSATIRSNACWQKLAN